MAIDDSSDGFSRHIFELYIRCAKLSLFSHTFRSLSKRYSRLPATFSNVAKFERYALESAPTIVRSVAWGTKIQGCLAYLPFCFGIMIACAKSLRIALNQDCESGVNHVGLRSTPGAMNNSMFNFDNLESDSMSPERFGRSTGLFPLADDFDLGFTPLQTLWNNPHN